MEHRQLGQTGVSVSKFCLGAMMFGAWGNPDHDDSIRIIHTALDAGINFIDTADVYAHGESEEIVGKARRRPPRRRDPRDQVPQRDGRGPQPLQRFVTEQPPYSIVVRAVEADVLPTCMRHGMAVMSYSPLTGGWLSGRRRKDTGQQSSSRANRLPERFDLEQLESQLTAIVPPGTTLNPADNSFDNPALEPAARRRRR